MFKFCQGILAFLVEMTQRSKAFRISEAVCKGNPEAKAEPLPVKTLLFNKYYISHMINFLKNLLPSEKPDPLVHLKKGEDAFDVRSNNVFQGIKKTRNSEKL